MEEEAYGEAVKDPSELNVRTLALVRAKVAASLLAEHGTSPGSDPLFIAAAYAQGALDLMPDEPDFAFLLAQVYMALGPNALELTAEAAEYALSLKPEWPEARIIFGMARFGLRSFTVAREQLELAVREKPELFDLPVSVTLGSSYFLDGQLLQGEEFLSGFVRERPENGPALLTLAVLRHGLGKVREGAADLEAAEKLLDEKTAGYARSLRAEWTKEGERK